MPNTPLIPIPPGYICLSREDYDGIMDRIHNIHDCAYEDLKYKDDEIGFLKKVLEDKQDEILSLQETVEEQQKQHTDIVNRLHDFNRELEKAKQEKSLLHSRIDNEIQFNGELETQKQLLFDFIVERNLVKEFNLWADFKKLENHAVPEES